MMAERSAKKFQSLLGKIIGPSLEGSRRWKLFQSLLGKIIVEYFTTYIILYTTSCVCQVISLGKGGQKTSLTTSGQF